MIRNSLSVVRACLIVLSVSCAMSAFSQSLPAKLTAYWNFDDASSTNTLDLKHGIVGTLTDGAIYTEPGGGRTGTGTDRSVDFGSNAQRQKVRVRNVAWLNQITAGDVITVSFWQKLRSTGASYAFWAVSPTRERAVSAHAPWSDNVVYFDTGGATAPATRWSINSTTFADFAWTNWNHIVLVKDGTSKQIWVNGLLRASTPDSTVPLVTDVSDFSIGGHPYAVPNATTGAVKGWMDDFAVFAGALDEAQITALAGGASPTTLDVDTDGDGMPDYWEERYAFLNKSLASDAALDQDLDGASNLREFQQLTDPSITDTDNDGLNDGAETGTGIWVSATNTGTDPLRKDTDDDGFLDGTETNTGTFVSLANPGTNPNLVDTDGDGFSDYSDAALGGNPLNNTVGALKSGQVNLLAWWDFNDATVTDIALDKIHSFRGTLMNGAVYTEPAMGRTLTGTDRALDLGTDVGELMDVDNPRWLGALSASNSITVSFWQKWNSPTPVANNTFYADDLRIYNVPILNGHVPWTDRNVYWDTTSSAATSGRINKVLATDFDLTLWHHYAFVKNGNAKQIYIDGALFHSGTSTGALPAVVHRLMVGGHTGTPTPKNSMNGLIDDFAIFAKGLSLTEVAALAAGATPGALASDIDGDGMPDLWEEGNLFDKNSAADAGLDADSDGLTNLQEYLKGTLARDDDSDDDGIKDGAETGTGTWVSATNTGTNPLVADTDADGLSDGVESNTGTFVSASNTGTSPLNTDSDGDLYPDFTEFLLGANPALGTATPISPGTVNLLAYWNFNTTTVPEETKDLIHNFTGTLEGGSIYTDDMGGRSGLAGDTAVAFPGIAGGVIKIPAGQFMSAVGPSNEMTISFWQRQNLAPPPASASFWVDSANPSLGRFTTAHVPWSDGSVYFDAGGGATAGQHRISRSMNTANPTFDWTAWNHIALVRKGTNQQIWINGTNFQQGAVTAPLQRDASTMGIGGQFSGANPFNGAIDDFAVYGTALDSTQIAALAAGASPQALPAGSFKISSSAFVAGAFAITFESVSGQTFKVFRSTDLTNWGTSIADVPANASGSTTTFTDSAPPVGANAVFYKIQRQ